MDFTHVELFSFSIPIEANSYSHSKDISNTMDDYSISSVFYKLRKITLLLSFLISPMNLFKTLAMVGLVILFGIGCYIAGGIYVGKRMGVVKHTEGGAEGINVGLDAFRTIPLNPLGGEVQTGVFDKKQGLEIAVIKHKKIIFIDPETFKVNRIIPVKDELIPGAKLININEDGRLNLMKAGGGYSEVGLFDLDGNELWSFHPNSNSLPPHRMIAEDIEGSGSKKFYVGDQTGVYKLDTNGQIIWRGNSLGNYYITTIPAESSHPALVVTEKGIWDGSGKQLQKGIKTSVGTYMLQKVKWGNSYCLASGQTSSEGGHVYVFDLEGKTLFDQSIGNWGVNDILSVRFRANEPPYLVVKGGRGSGTRLMSLNIFSHDGTLVYQENCPNERLNVITNDITGVDTLLLCRYGIRKLEKVDTQNQAPSPTPQ